MSLSQTADSREASRGIFQVPLLTVTAIFCLQGNLGDVADIYLRMGKEKIIQVILLILIAFITAHLFTGSCPTCHWVKELRMIVI